MKKPGIVTMPVPVTEAENRTITEFCEDHGYKKSAWIRKLALNAIAAEKQKQEATA